MRAQYQHRFSYKMFILLPVQSCLFAVSLVVAGFTVSALMVRIASDTLKGIIRSFELKEIYLFYYLIDAGEFSYSNDMHYTTISGLS